MGKQGIFGDLSKDIRGQRLLSIGIGMGLVLGALAPWDGLRYGLAFFGFFIIFLRTVAQKYWPDREADDNPVDR
jgi:hypothetical protein